jgi:hypothetical protein
MKYIASIEGQPIPLPENVALDDGKIKAALAPYFPAAANSKIMRSEPVDDVVTVTVIKQAGTKGGSMSNFGRKKLDPNKQKRKIRTWDIVKILPNLRGEFTRLGENGMDVDEIVDLYVGRIVQINLVWEVEGTKYATIDGEITVPLSSCKLVMSV